MMKILLLIAYFIYSFLSPYDVLQKSTLLGNNFIKANYIEYFRNLGEKVFDVETEDIEINVIGGSVWFFPKDNSDLYTNLSKNNGCQNNLEIFIWKGVESIPKFEEIWSKFVTSAEEIGWEYSKPMLSTISGIVSFRNEKRSISGAFRFHKRTLVVVLCEEIEIK
jgi:hypothetical protein